MEKAATKAAVATPAKTAAVVATLSTKTELSPEFKAEIVRKVAGAFAANESAEAMGKAKADAGSDAIWVRTKPGVARRCRSGMAFTSVPVLLPVDELTQDQLDAIEADPLLESVDAPEAFVVDAQANGTAE